MNSKNADSSFLSSLADVLRKLQLSSETPLKVAFSGGLDSTALLHALSALRQSLNLSLEAIHVDHGLHPDSKQWANRARRYCSELNVPCLVEQVVVARISDFGLEDAARRVRYKALGQYVQTGDVLLTAHHADDQAETLLLQLLRGTGVPGLSAMPAISAFFSARLARPFLEFRREQIFEYAKRHQLTWIEDTSNSDIRLSRNYLRHQIFPMLEARWPNASRQFVRAAGMSSEALVLLNEVADVDWHQCKLPDHSHLSVMALRRLSEPRRKNLLRHWLRQLGFMAPSAMHLKQIDMQVMCDTRSNQSIVRWNGIEVCRYRDRLYTRQPSMPIDANWRHDWDLKNPLTIPGVGILSADRSVGDGLSRDRVFRLPIEITLRQGGEVCQLPGRHHHHKVKKLLQEAGIPPWERARLPLLYVRGDLAAIGDRWVCEPYAAKQGELGWKLHFCRS